VHILGSELPISASLFGIAPLRPGSYLMAECFQIRDALVQTSLDEHAQFDFGDVQPTSHAWGCNESPTDQTTAVLRRVERLCTKEVGVWVFNWSQISTAWSASA